MKLAMSAAHGGFGSERVPLGGGAAVFERLIRSGVFADWDLQLLGAGPIHPEDGRYHRIVHLEKAPSALGMLDYAKFCSEFGKATTRKIIEIQPDVVLCHDISEGPDVSALRDAGIPVATIFHVDVVDIFNRLYLKSVLRPETLTRLYRRAAHLRWPEVLKLVFQKQQAVCDQGSLSIVPSNGAEALLRKCYPDSDTPIETIPWGAPDLEFAEDEISNAVARLKSHHRIPEDHAVLLTLSRLSPEKAQHRLLQAAAVAERSGRMPGATTIVIAGAPAFMDGERHARRLRKLAGRLNTRVVFPGHVGGVEKAAWYRLATLFIVNSLHESYGLTTLEAMQQGCPVVAVRSFGTADTVDKSVGMLVPPGPELELRLWGTIEVLLKSDRTSLRARARQRAAEQTFDKAAQRVRKAMLSVHNE